MLSDVFVNITVLISFLFLFGLLYKQTDFDKRQSIRTRLLIGLLYGALGLVLMVYTIHVSKDVIIDLRNIAIISSGILGGPLSAILTSLVIAFFRVVYFGVSKASMIAFTVAIFLGTVTSVICSLKLSRKKKISFSFIFAMVISTIALIYLIPDQNKLRETLIYYWMIYLLGAILSYFALKYIVNTNLTYISMAINTLMADNLLDMLSTHKLDGTYVNISPSSIHLLGYFPKELEGIDLLKLIHSQDIDIVKQLLFLNKPNNFTRIYRMKRKDGTFIWVETNAKIVNVKGDLYPEIVCATRDITARKAVEQELINAKAEAEKMASIDYLTGIFNRRAFVERFNTEVERAVRENLVISLILADIDEFKKINDSFGHNVGDLVLKEFTSCLENLCRSYDFIGRHGGEEFVICLPHTNCEQAFTIAERMRSSVEQLTIELINVKKPIRITASFGVYSYKEGETPDIEMLIVKADKAMYQAKTNGRNRVCTTCEI